MDLDEEDAAAFEGEADDEHLIRLPDPNADKANLQHGKPLEHLLMAKNRKLQDEVTALRVAHDELAVAHETVSADYEHLQSRLQEQTALSDRLENDLLRINESRQGGQSQAPLTQNREDPLANLQLGKKARLFRDQSVHGVLTLRCIQVQDAPPVQPHAFQSSAETSILPIITSQRDRFRQRNSELEEVRWVLMQSASLLLTYAACSGTAPPIQHDHRIAERDQNAPGRQPEAVRKGPLPAVVPGRRCDRSGAERLLQRGARRRGARALPEQVRGEHESLRSLPRSGTLEPIQLSRLDTGLTDVPSVSFGQERGRAMHNLNPLEKVLLTLSTVVLSNRISRNLFVLYALGLHFFVLSTLYHYTLSNEAAQTVVPPI